MKLKINEKLNSKNKNFDKILDNLLLQRKKKAKINSISVTKIINDVKKNGDKALLKYEKKFNKNKIIKPNSKQISKSIKFLDKKVKNAIDFAYKEFINFIHYKNLKIFLTQINLKIN